MEFFTKKNLVLLNYLSLRKISQGPKQINQIIYKNFQHHVSVYMILLCYLTLFFKWFVVIALFLFLLIGLINSFCLVIVLGQI